jgi:hypothetical protein
LNNSVDRLRALPSRASLILVLAVVAITAVPLLGSTQNFSIPDDVVLRIRLDDTLTSVDSQAGDPFSATVVDKSDYQNARVYGHVAQTDMSGKIKGHTSMMLRFDRLVMPDGRRAPIHAEIVELYHAPSGEKVDVEGAIESGGRGRKTIEHTAIGAGQALCWVASSGAARAPVLVPLSVAQAGWELRPSMGIRRSRLTAARKC